MIAYKSVSNSMVEKTVSKVEKFVQCWIVWAQVKSSQKYEEAVTSIYDLPLGS